MAKSRPDASFTSGSSRGLCARPQPRRQDIKKRVGTCTPRLATGSAIRPLACRAASTSSHVEKHCFLLALKVDIEMVGVARARRDQRRYPVLVFQPRVDRVFCARLLFIAETHARLEAQIDAAGHDPERDMRRLKAAIGEGHTARLDGFEGEHAFLVGGLTAPAGEVRIGLPTRF